MLSEELILHFVSKLYSNYNIRQKTIVRVTRNADIDEAMANDEDIDYRDMMTNLIKKRNRLSPVRLELSREISDSAKLEIADLIGMDKANLINVSTPLDLSFLFEIQNYLQNKENLFYKKRSPRNSTNVDYKLPIIPQIEKKDILLSYPFESMKPFIKMLEEAACDEKVVSIKMTLYRVAERSKIIDTLVEAAENGKEVVVLVELRARFDEANNIEMSKRLEEAGCQILYGLGEYKVHSKLCLITRKSNNGSTYITQIGTGNYNEKTARLYTDLSLMTANQSIGAEVANVFAALQKGETVTETTELMVAPNCLQNKVVTMIEEQITLAKNKEEAYIGIKVNSLTDRVIMEKLIEASKAGVKVELIVRGICCLRPGIKGITDNITVVSVVGRYLEHSRIYRFGTGENQKVYIASADFMTRNTVKRVEVAVPLLDAEIRKRVCDIFELIMQDDEKGKEQTSEGAYVDRQINDNKLDSQELLFEEAYAATGEEA